MSVLVTHVSLRDDEGNVVSFGPGDNVPAWARKRITNAAVWDTPPDEERPEGVPGKSGEQLPPNTDEIPPLSGAGSGRDAWAEYAVKKGVEVSATEKRDDIVDKLREAKIPVE